MLVTSLNEPLSCNCFDPREVCVFDAVNVSAVCTIWLCTDGEAFDEEFSLEQEFASDFSSRVIGEDVVFNILSLLVEHIVTVASWI